MKKIFALLLLFTALGYSQVDSTAVEDPISIKSDILLGFNINGGNNPSYGGNFKSNLTVDRGKWETAFAPNFTMVYSPINGVATLTKREAYESINITHNINKTWKVLGFSEVENSFIRRINLRWNGGVGLGYSTKSAKYDFGLSEVIVGEGMNTKLNTSDYFVLRSSTRLKLVYRVGTMTLSSISLYQPAIHNNQLISNSEFLIIRSNNKVEFKISKKMSSGITYDVVYQSYSSYLSPTIKKYDWNSVFFISYNL